MILKITYRFAWALLLVGSVDRVGEHLEVCVRVIDCLYTLWLLKYEIMDELESSAGQIHEQVGTSWEDKTKDM